MVKQVVPSVTEGSYLFILLRILTANNYTEAVVLVVVIVIIFISCYVLAANVGAC